MVEKTTQRKLDEQLLKRLHSEDEKTVLKALSQLRSSGNPGYLPELFVILNNTKSEAIHREMANFFADIKDNAARPMFIRGLKDPKLPGIRKAVLAGCWLSELDYSPHIDLFIELFLESDYLTSLESFSLIEQSIENMTEEDLMKKRELIINGFEKIGEDKKPLARELINLMQA